MAQLNQRTLKLFTKLRQMCRQLCVMKQAERARYDWGLQAREQQRIPPGSWRVWLVLAGRGFGKTRMGAETIRHWIATKKCTRVALIGETEHDATHVMVTGESGIMAVSPPTEKPTFVASHRQLTWANGAVATLFSGDCPDQLRGPQFDGAWIDEIAKFKNPETLWNMLNMGLRLGKNPQVIITTTPRNLPFIQKLLADAALDDSEIVVTRGTTFENAKNLAHNFIQSIKKSYGTGGLARQELYGEIIDTRENGLWTFSMIDRHRFKEMPALTTIVVAVDPAVTDGKNSDETGIVVAGKCAAGKGYILEDSSGKMPALEWAKKICALYHKYAADRIVVEVNQGGDLVRSLIRQVDTTIPIREVRATRGKLTRAEPVLALYDQGLIYHPQAGLERLENQMTAMSGVAFGKGSPDRVDALVWGLTDLFLNQRGARIWSA